VLLGQEVRAVNGKGHLEAVTVEDLHSGGRRRLAARALVVLIGATAKPSRPTPSGRCDTHYYPRLRRGAPALLLAAPFAGGRTLCARAARRRRRFAIRP